MNPLEKLMAAQKAAREAAAAEMAPKIDSPSVLTPKAAANGKSFSEILADRIKARQNAEAEKVTAKAEPLLELDSPAPVIPAESVAPPADSPPDDRSVDVFMDSERDWEDEEFIEDEIEIRREVSGDLFNILEGVTVVPDPSQVIAYQGLARVQMGCLIGAAGTGKTTTTRLLLHTLMNGDPSIGLEPVRLVEVDLDSYNGGEEGKANQPAVRGKVPSIALVAFTGQAVQVLKKNVPANWGNNCMTIHSLLGYAPVEYEKDGKKTIRFEPSYTAQFKMPWDIIIIDEASMVNTYLWHEMRAAAKDSCRFYFIGDLNQLTPPLGEGILGFALARLPTFELTVVHRQKDEAANKIVDSAWNILQGKPPVFDDPFKDPNWRVLGFQIDSTPDKAHTQICAIAKGLAEKKVAAEIDPAQPAIYDPFRDRIMTAMNGFDDGQASSAVGQFPLNDSLSRIFGDKEHDRIVIDCKRMTKTFAVGYRVMATKNEPPSRLDRVTNGLTGRIVDIYENTNWVGDRRLVGLESEVKKNRQEMLLSILDDDDEMGLGEKLEFRLPEKGEKKEDEERQSGPCSHVVVVAFDNGGTRTYALNAQVEQLMLAYASTTHKAQGAEMPTAIIVVHHVQRMMLCRENLYTAVTRARERVIILYTDYGMRLALANQKIRGTTLAEKIKRYIELSGEGSSGMKVMNVRLLPEDK